MVSFRPRSIIKHRKTSASRAKQEHLKRPPVSPRATKVVKTDKFPRLFLTLRPSTLSKRFSRSYSRSEETGGHSHSRRNIIRVSVLNFDSVNKPPIIIPGPSMPSLKLESDWKGLSLADRFQAPRGDNCRHEVRDVEHPQEGTDLKDVTSTSSSTGSLGSWVEVSEWGSRPAVRVQVGLFSGAPSDSLLEGLQALLPRSIPARDSANISLTSTFRDISDVEAAEPSISSFNEVSFVRIGELDLGW